MKGYLDLGEKNGKARLEISLIGADKLEKNLILFLNDQEINLADLIQEAKALLKAKELLGDLFNPEVYFANIPTFIASYLKSLMNRNLRVTPDFIIALIELVAEIRVEAYIQPTEA